MIKYAHAVSTAMNHYQESVYLQGHIIDSLVLAKVLDLILMMGGNFRPGGRPPHRQDQRGSISCPYSDPNRLENAFRRYSKGDSTSRRLDRT